LGPAASKFVATILRRRVRLYLVAIGNIALTAALVLFPAQISISPLSAIAIAFLVNFPLLSIRMTESG